MSFDADCGFDAGCVASCIAFSRRMLTCVYTSVLSRRLCPSISWMCRDITGLDATGRYLRMYSRARTTPYGVSLWELEVWGDIDTTCQP